MRRRKFIAGLASITVASPLAGRAQQSSMPVVGFLNTQSSLGNTHLVTGFLKGLRQTGFFTRRTPQRAGASPPNGRSSRTSVQIHPVRVFTLAAQAPWCRRHECARRRRRALLSLSTGTTVFSRKRGRSLSAIHEPKRLLRLCRESFGKSCPGINSTPRWSCGKSGKGGAFTPVRGLREDDCAASFYTATLARERMLTHKI
jgi:hypothetical protein